MTYSYVEARVLVLHNVVSDKCGHLDIFSVFVEDFSHPPLDEERHPVADTVFPEGYRRFPTMKECSAWMLRYRAVISNLIVRTP